MIFFRNRCPNLLRIRLKNESSGAEGMFPADASAGACPGFRQLASKGLFEKSLEAVQIVFGVPPSGGFRPRPPEGGIPNGCFQTGSKSKGCLLQKILQ
jgi:hypothetical protein